MQANVCTCKRHGGKRLKRVEGWREVYQVEMISGVVCSRAEVGAQSI